MSRSLGLGIVLSQLFGQWCIWGCSAGEKGFFFFFFSKMILRVRACVLLSARWEGGAEGENGMQTMLITQRLQP